VQKSVYKHLLSSKEIRHIFEGKQTNILSNIGALQKLCNHPLLLQEAAGGSSTRGNNPSAGMKAYQAQTAAAGGGLSDEIAHLLPPSIRYGSHTP
jgi:SNF2 family DNA or RNA helicase